MRCNTFWTSRTQNLWTNNALHQFFTIRNPEIHMKTMRCIVCPKTIIQISKHMHCVTEMIFRVGQLNSSISNSERNAKMQCVVRTSSTSRIQRSIKKQCAATLLQHQQSETLSENTASQHVLDIGNLEIYQNTLRRTTCWASRIEKCMQKQCLGICVQHPECWKSDDAHCVAARVLHPESRNPYENNALHLFSNIQNPDIYKTHCVVTWLSVSNRCDGIFLSEETCWNTIRRSTFSNST